MIAALLGSVGEGFAGSNLPKCAGSPHFFTSQKYDITRAWDNYIEKKGYRSSGNYRDYYYGEFKNGQQSGFGTAIGWQI